jgi:hypothetical protein
LADQIIEHVHLTQRQIAETRWDSRRGDRRTRQWPEAAAVSKITKITSICNICGWRERGFDGVEHSESALCPVCGSISRDRFLYWCWTKRTSYDPKAVVLRPRPGLGGEYRVRMTQRVDYTASDYDESMHKAVIRLDLQAIDLPDSSLDVVPDAARARARPDTDKALSSCSAS